MTSTTTYQHHVDARYFNFLWTDAQYLTIEYLVIHAEKILSVTVQNITAPPWLLGTIVVHSGWKGWQELMAEIDESARQHAEKELQPVVDAEMGRDYNAGMITNNVFKSLGEHFRPK